MSSLFLASKTDINDFQQIFAEIPVPANLSSSYDRPSIDVAVSQHSQRLLKF